MQSNSVIDTKHDRTTLSDLFEECYAPYLGTQPGFRRWARRQMNKRKRRNWIVRERQAWGDADLDL